MLKIANLIFCKEVNELTKLQKRYPCPEYKWRLFNQKYPIFLIKDKNTHEIYRITPLKAKQEAIYLSNHTKNEEKKNICNKIIAYADKYQPDYFKFTPDIDGYSIEKEER